MNVTKLIVIIIGVLILAGAIVGLMKYATIKREIQLRNLTEAQVEVAKANFDKMWKIIKQQAGVTDKSKDDFIAMYTPLMEGRYGGEKGNPLMKWIQEQNPTFDFASLHGKLMRSIEDNRTEFFNEQKKLISYGNNYKMFVEDPLTQFFIGKKEPIDYSQFVITSAVTKAVYDTGEENDIDLFK